MEAVCMHISHHMLLQATDVLVSIEHAAMAISMEAISTAHVLRMIIMTRTAVIFHEVEVLQMAHL